MKKLIEETNETNGFESLLGQEVLLMCVNYFYAGKLTQVGDEDVLLSDASIVYETGSWDESGWSDRQSIGRDLFVRISAVESYVAV